MVPIASPTWGVAWRSPTGCRNNCFVATATVETAPRTPASRPNLVSVGTIVWLSSELMFFAALFAMYFTVRSVANGSVFYIPTGFHGLHVAGGLVAFIFLLGRTYAARTFTHEQQVSAIVVSYYWHFVDVVWIGLFTVIYLIH